MIISIFVTLQEQNISKLLDLRGYDQEGAEVVFLKDIKKCENYSEAYSEHCRASKMECFAKLVNSF